MTNPQEALDEALERLRAVNPVPAEAAPDWRSVTEHVMSRMRAEEPRPLPAPMRWYRRRKGRFALAGSALCAAIAAGALIAVAPWSGSSDYLARAAAALTPGIDTVLYERWEEIVTPEPGNRAGVQRQKKFGPDQLWVEGDAPHHYRTVLRPSSEGATVTPRGGLSFGVYGSMVVGTVGEDRNFVENLPRALGGRALELGGVRESPAQRTHPGLLLPTLTFLAPNRLVRARLRITIGPSMLGPHDQAIEDGSDPVDVLRAAIAEGRAHEAGSTQLDGHAVLRIDIDPPELPAQAPPLPPNAPTIHTEDFAYVEPETFHPVKLVFGRAAYRFLAYEHLPATSANLALASIRAQHPDATIVKAGFTPRAGAFRVRAPVRGRLHVRARSATPHR